MIELTNSHGVRATFFKSGARIHSLFVPDKAGNFSDVVLGYDTEEEYAEKHIYHGAICGRYANRIAGAQFIIDGQQHMLIANDGANTLHGGSPNFSEVQWSVEEVSKSSVLFSYFSKAGEAGFPGNVQCRVRYTLTNENALQINLTAETDATTPLNLTSHPYFNLAGEGSESCLDHLVQINAEQLVEVDVACIPTGALAPVANGPFDFRQPKPIAQHINAQHKQLTFGNGYDHCFVTNNQHQATVVHSQSGRTLKVFSTYPGIQFYTANWLKETGKANKSYSPRNSFCLEPQFFPNSPNQPKFHNTFVSPEAPYTHSITYQFGIL